MSNDLRIDITLQHQGRDFKPYTIIKERNVSSRMRHFHQEFSVEPPRFLKAVC